ncbi:sulfhydryl oxidase 2 isoform X1 [Anoplophora glabripennis]|uniref:sulfhydryl oxidase 2 isoform X1 n=1 Tax=Anoplophora glabripennis TaxID=217634 RepID=UPI000874D9F6|nr:sulfhydryl oxidase 2 isoform X1 [Anoplophora glabripennis]
MLNLKNFLFWILLNLVLVKLSNNAALSIYEQKKYKRYTDSQGLYSNKDDVEILTLENFKSEIYGNRRAWLVEFYNSWCGFCQRFAPSWKALATDVREWKDVIAIGVLDCSNDDNYPICRDFEVMAYPTLRYFHENYQEGPKNFGVKVRAGSDVNEHRQKLLEVIVQEQNESRGKMYPNLLPYDSNNVSQLYELISENVKYIFLIVQEPSQFVGEEVIMDLHHINDFIVRYAFNNNSELVNTLNVNKYPALFAIEKGSSPQKLNSITSDREGFKIAIRSFLIPKNINVPLNDTNKQIYKGKWVEAQVPDMTSFMQEREREALKEKVKKMGDVVFQMDLETALRYSLKREVGSVKEITGDKLEALKAYINILVKYFPFGKYGQAFLVELKDYISNEETVKGSEIGKIVKDAEKEDRQVFSSPQQWLGCKGSSSSYRGYPCGVWKMFHYLTVNAADSSSGLKGTNPKVALEAMHGYIKNFFGCADCSNHFQEMAKRREIDKVQSWDDSILWLWMAHNEVNKRLSGDPTEDPEYPKIQFPSKERCTQCYDKDDSWKLPEVLHYLKQVYSNINVRYIGSDTRILHLGLDGSLSSNSSSVFKTIDTIVVLLGLTFCYLVNKCNSQRHITTV